MPSGNIELKGILNKGEECEHKRKAYKVGNISSGDCPSLLGFRFRFNMVQKYKDVHFQLILF